MLSQGITKMGSATTKTPLGESQGDSTASGRSVTSHMQRLRSKENGTTPVVSKLQRPQSARTFSSTSQPGANARGAVTARGERPASANAAQKVLASAGGAATPSRVPRFSKNTSASSQPPARTATKSSTSTTPFAGSAVSSYGGSPTLRNSLGHGRMSTGNGGSRWV